MVIHIHWKTPLIARALALLVPVFYTRGFPGGAVGKEYTHQYRRRKRCGFNPWKGMIPRRRKWQPTLVFLPRKFHGQRSLAGYIPWDHKELDMTEHTGITLTLKNLFELGLLGR